MPEYFRHDLIWRWNENLPYVVTRQPAISSDKLLVARCLGLDKSVLSRQTFLIDTSEITNHTMPVKLMDILNEPELREKIIASDQQTFILSMLDKLANTISVCCYGSFSWEYLTNKIYTTATSDLDLLFYVKNEAELSGVADLFDKLNSCAKLPIDGEIIFNRKCSVAIREWFDSSLAFSEKILVKTSHEVNLLTQREVFQYAGISPAA
jgi:malonate decarboxylase holo-[acyl-carrier-protein] synthase